MLEEVVISCFLTDKSTQDYIDKLEVNDFLNTDNRTIFTIMKGLRKDNIAIDYVTVANKMPFSELSIKTLPMVDVRFKTQNIADYVKQLKKQSATRTVRDILTKARYDMMVDGKSVDDIIKDTTDTFNTIDLLDDDKLVDVGLIDSSKYKNRTRIKSEFPNLDKMIGGFSLR